MNAMINLFVALTFIFATLTQTNQIGKGTGYGIAGACAAIAMTLAIARYINRKRSGE